MDRETELLLERLRKSEWFTRVGKPVNTDLVVPVDSWRCAVAHADSAEWGNLTLRVKNEQSNAVLEHFGDDAFPWNEMADKLRGAVRALVDDRIGRLRIEKEFRKVVGDNAAWDVLGACMEVQFREYIRGTFFGVVAEWYMRGRFPCGWEGKYPQGKLIVF